MPKHTRLVAAVAVITLPAITVAGSAGADDTTHGVLIPIGSDYLPPTLQLVASEAAKIDTTGNVKLLVLPVTYSLDAYVTDETERADNLALADTHRVELFDACEAVRDADATCEVAVVPALIRDDAFLDSNLAFFDDDVDGMYVLGGDQGIGMQLLVDTPLEAAMTAAFERGAVLGGNSAGAAVQSRTMINGYTGDNGRAEGMREGSVLLWADDGPGDQERGLPFGFPNIVAEQHVFERGRVGRSLNVAIETGLPILGMDAGTGAVVTDSRTVSDVTGLTSGVVIDTITWGATGTYGGSNATLSTRDVAMHVLAPGGDGFDFSSMQPTEHGAAVPAPSIRNRSYPRLDTPGDAGPLMLSGGIVWAADQEIADRFAVLAGGARGRVVVLSTAAPTPEDAQANADLIAEQLAPAVRSVTTFVIDADTDVRAVARALGRASGIVLTGADRSTVMADLRAQPKVLAAIRSEWKDGTALLADDAAAAVLGRRYSADPIPDDYDAEAILDLLADGVDVQRGLGWVSNVNVQPYILLDTNMGQLLQLVAHDQRTLGIGLETGTALEIRGGRTTVVGSAAAIVIDGRRADISTGTNTSLSASWLVVDSFVDGERLRR